MKTLLFILISITMMAQTQAQESNLSLITTQGSATVYAAPDEALISFSVITNDNDIKGAKDKNSEISRRTIAFLKGMKVDEKHIQTQYLNIGINHRYSRNPNTEMKYEARQQFTVCVKDLEKLEAIISGMLMLEISNLGTPMFRTTELEMHKNEARRKAILNAKEKAGMLAKELNQSIGKAHIINEMSYNSPAPRAAYAKFAAESAPMDDPGGDSFALGQLEIKATIEVSFVLK